MFPLHAKYLCTLWKNKTIPTSWMGQGCLLTKMRPQQNNPSNTCSWKTSQPNFVACIWHFSLLNPPPNAVETSGVLCNCSEKALESLIKSIYWHCYSVHHCQETGDLNIMDSEIHVSLQRRLWWENQNAATKLVQDLLHSHSYTCSSRWHGCWCQGNIDQRASGRIKTPEFFQLFILTCFVTPGKWSTFYSNLCEYIQYLELKWGSL